MTEPAASRAAAWAPTPEQEAVIQAQEGPLLVLAPVGSGKTTVLALRLLRAVEEGRPAESCLCLTFTNRAARELKERLARLAGVAPHATVRTFHGFCAAFLREEAEAAGLPGDFGILDDADSEDLLALLRRRLELPEPTQGGDRGLYFRWGRRLSALTTAQLKAGRIPAAALQGLEAGDRTLLAEYLAELGRRGAVDFPLLVYRTRALLSGDEAVRARWSSRWSWVQVDEVQDTHLSEWDVLRPLVETHRNLAFFGDLDQTIYGWRGSRPDALLEAFADCCGEPKRLLLSLNQRGTRRILELAAHVARGLPERATTLSPAPELPEGEEVRWILGDNPADEAERVAQDLLQRFSADPASRGRSAVLVRSAAVGARLRRVLAASGIPTASEEDLRLGRRPEVKALLAPLQLVANGDDRQAFGRWLRFAGLTAPLKEALADIAAHGPDCRLEASDLLDPRALAAGDPFHDLLRALRARFVVILDFETTGLRPERDEIVEIACQRWSRDFKVDEFHRLLKPTVELGGSEAVHGIPAERLKREGVDPAEGLRDLLDYLGDALVVGHNVGFDLGMLRAQARRLDVQLPALASCDTLRLARRVLGAGSLRLGDLRERLALPSAPTHRAMDDVQTTAELLLRLLPEIAAGAEDRRELSVRHAAAFRPLAERLERLRRLADTLRPWELLREVLGWPGYRERLGGPEDPPESVRRLIGWFRRLDEAEYADLPPAVALRELLAQSALAQPADLLDEDTLPVLTIHAAKGMEFEHVWLAGATQGTLPDFRNASGERLDEERRVCYVAVTRPKRTLAVSASRLDGRGRPAGFSEFFREVARP